MVIHSFTKVSLNVFLTNTHILIMYWYTRCDSKLWNVPWFYCIFWVFWYIIDDNSCLKCCISTIILHIVWLINVHIFTSQYTILYFRLSKVLWFNRIFFGNFHILLHDWSVITSSNFYKVCVKGWKVNLCSHTWLRQSCIFGKSHKIESDKGSLISILKNVTAFVTNYIHSTCRNLI